LPLTSLGGFIPAMPGGRCFTHEQRQSILLPEIPRFPCVAWRRGIPGFYFADTKRQNHLNTIFKDALLRFCAPVVLGKKPAALFPKPPCWEKEFSGTGITSGIQCLTLSRAGKNTLLLVYRSNLLAAILGDPAIHGPLKKLEYPAGLEDQLRHLSRRFLTNQEFPHEIGFFLGYPPSDVTGFITHRGTRCKLCGPWKVYGDVEKASATFQEYERCKQQLAGYIQNGAP
jgi:hypothetical protein